MPDIKRELIGFLTAVNAGVVVRLSYHSLVCLRKIFKHKKVMIELEDALYWLAVSIYLFVQIYHTSNGVIRWYFVLGIVFGAIISTIFIRKMKKVLKKIYNIPLVKNIAEKSKKRYDNRY